jgi:hypothetical protein
VPEATFTSRGHATTGKFGAPPQNPSESGGARMCLPAEKARGASTYLQPSPRGTSTVPVKPPHDGDAEGLDARVLLPYAPSLAVNPLTATDEGTGSGSRKSNPGIVRSNVHRTWRAARSPASLFIAALGRGVSKDGSGRESVNRL